VSSSTWLGVPDADLFGIDHLPYGMAVLPDESTRLVVRIGDRVVDVTTLGQPASLDDLLAVGPEGWARSRRQITALLADEAHIPDVEPSLYDMDDVRLVMPITVADYVDFYASEHHATNVGRMFRPDGEPLTPNWKHLPIGYHGRAGTVVVSGTDVVRPHGQYLAGDAVTFGPSTKLDFEAEVAFVVGTPADAPVPVAAFGEHVFGVCLLDDWSARDIQAWETVPLGPFLGKSFATSVSAWVTPLAALEHAWTWPGPRDPQPLPYLDDSAAPRGLDLQLEVRLNGEVIATPPFSAMYWTPPQLLAHLTVNGATLRTGDLFASGTVSGPAPTERGCLLELTWNGTSPLQLADGDRREFLADGDTVTITATAPGPRGRLGLGEVTGTIRASREPERGSGTNR
jgi:fumarylacetoacetase